MGIRSASVSTLAAVLVAFAPVHAVAQEAQANQGVQDRPRPDYDPLGRRIGGFTLQAGVNLFAGTNDNVFATETNEQDDMEFSVNPYGSLDSNWSRHALSFSAGANFNRFQDFDSENTESSYIGTYGRLDVGRDSNVSASLRLANETEPRTAPDAGGLAEPVEYQRREAQIGAEHTINRFRLSGVIGTNDTDYDGLGQSFRDRTENYVGGRVAVAVSPRLQVLGDVRFDEREYDSAPALNSDGRTIAAGVRMNLTGLLSGEVTVGQFEREYLNDKVDGVAFAGNVQWFATPITTVTLRGRRDVEETGASGAATYIASDMGVRVDHELRRNIILSGGIGRIQREYEAPTDREDEATYADIGVEYLLNRRVALETRYDRFDNSSDGLDRDRDFEVNRFTVGVKIRL
ncbi:outer membrane protein [alpha proteobacterium U9-1i]|nr:outer membrane protein [alpha proteobacterium U9-1i]